MWKKLEQMQWMGEQITKGKNIKVFEKRGKKWKIQMSRTHVYGIFQDEKQALSRQIFL